MSVRGSVRTVANGLVLFVLLLYLFVMVGFHAVAPGDTEQAASAGPVPARGLDL